MSCKAESSEIEFRNLDTDKRGPTKNDKIIITNYLSRVIIPLIAITDWKIDAIKFIDEGLNDVSFDHGDIVIRMLLKGLQTALKRAEWKAHRDDGSATIYFHKKGMSRIIAVEE